MLDIEKRAANLNEVRTSAQTIVSSGEKIIKRVDIDERALEKQLSTLREKLGDVRTALGCDTE